MSKNDIASLHVFALLVTAGLMPAYIIRFSVGGIPTNVFEICVFACFLLGVASYDIHRAWMSTVRSVSWPVVTAIILFLTSTIISTVISDELSVSLGILKSWFVIPVMFAFMVASAIKSNEITRSRIINSLIVSGVAVSLIGIAQIGFYARVRSVYDVSNSLALYIVPIMILALYTGLQVKNRMYIASAIIMFIAVLATQSFGAIFAIVGTVVVGGVLSRCFPSPILGEGAMPANRQAGEGHSLSEVEDRRRFSPHPRPLLSKERGIPVLFGIFFLIMTFTFLSPRLHYLISPLTHPNTTNSATVRLQLWDIGIRLIQQHPLLGIGLGQFEPAYQAELHRLFTEQVSLAVMPDLIGHPRRSKLIPEFVFRDPHNWIIAFWLNLGLLGLVSFIGLNYIVIAKSLPSPVLGESQGEGKAVYRQAIALALISILLFGLVDTIYWKNDLSALWWMLIGLLI